MTKAEQTRLLQQRDDDWNWLIGHPAGRRILAELLGPAYSDVMAPSVSPENPLRLSYLSGRREIGLQIYARITNLCDPSSLPALLAEVMVPPNVRDSPARNRSEPVNDDG